MSMPDSFLAKALPRSARRVGYTLIECLVVVTIVSVVMTAITATTHALYRAERSLRAAAEEERILERFIVQLRLDAHLARSASQREAVDGLDGLSDLAFRRADDREVLYRFKSRHIQRLVHRGEIREHTETYRIQVMPGTHWRMRGSTDKRLVGLELRHGGGRESDHAPPRVRNIVAAIGLVVK